MFYLRLRRISLTSQVCIGVVITFVGTISTLIDSLSFVILLFNSFNFAAVIVFRKKAKYKDVPRPVKASLDVEFVFDMVWGCWDCN